MLSEQSPTHFDMTTLFTALLADTTEKDGIAISVDDCDCEECTARRGDIHIYSTLELAIVKDGHAIIQRLTPGEAKDFAKKIIRYAEFVQATNNAVAEQLNEMEDYV